MSITQLREKFVAQKEQMHKEQGPIRAIANLIVDQLSLSVEAKMHNSALIGAKIAILLEQVYKDKYKLDPENIHSLVSDIKHVTALLKDLIISFVLLKDADAKTDFIEKMLQGAESAFIATKLYELAGYKFANLESKLLKRIFLAPHLNLEGNVIATLDEKGLRYGIAGHNQIEASVLSSDKNMDETIESAPQVTPTLAVNLSEIPILKIDLKSFAPQVNDNSVVLDKDTWLSKSPQTDDLKSEEYKVWAAKQTFKLRLILDFHLKIDAIMEKDGQIYLLQCKSRDESQAFNQTVNPVQTGITGYKAEHMAAARLFQLAGIKSGSQFYSVLVNLNINSDQDFINALAGFSQEGLL